MPLIYSPLDGSEWDEPVELRPRTAFLMSHAGNRVAQVEQEMLGIVQGELDHGKFLGIAATDVRRSGDFLAKILRLIRGCGFGVAIFSDATPGRTLANIFFEVGICLTLGKPTFLTFAGDSAVPSDFVRSEWIRYEPENPERFKSEVRASFADLREYGQHLLSLGEAAAEAEEIDFETAFERFRRAALLTGPERAVDAVRQLRQQLRTAHSDPRRSGEVTKAHRTYLINRTNDFLRLYPD